MPVRQLCRITDGIGRDGVLPLGIQRAGRPFRCDHLKPKLGKKGMPKRQVLIHIEYHRDADFPARAALRLVSIELLQLVLVQIWKLLPSAAAQRALAPVARDKFVAVCKHIDRQAAMVGTQVTGGRF